MAHPRDHSGALVRTQPFAAMAMGLKVASRGRKFTYDFWII